MTSLAGSSCTESIAGSVVEQFSGLTLIPGEDIYLYIFFLFQYNFIKHTHVQLTFTKDNLQQNENYNLKLTKKKPNTIKTLVVTKWEGNQLSEQNFTPYLKETKKQTILFGNLFRDQSYKKYIFLD